MRQGIAQMEDILVVILNYRADGSTSWNQMFISPLRDGKGEVVNYLDVQCKVARKVQQFYCGKMLFRKAKRK